LPLPEEPCSVPCWALPLVLVARFLPALLFVLLAPAFFVLHG
jgi:hypothetical protein